MKLLLGLELCFGQPIDKELLNLITRDVGELRSSVEKCKFENDAEVCEFTFFLIHDEWYFDSTLCFQLHGEFHLLVLIFNVGTPF